MGESCTTIWNNSSHLPNFLANVGPGKCYSRLGRKISPKNTNFNFARNTSWKRSKFCDSLQGLSQAAAAATRDSQAPYCSMLHSSTDNQEIFHRKNLHIFQSKRLKLATTRSGTALRSRFSSCHIYQLRLGLKFGILDAWSWSAVCPRLVATVGPPPPPQLRKWRSRHPAPAARHGS